MIELTTVWLAFALACGFVIVSAWRVISGR